MARPETLSFGAMKISLGNGAQPEVFAAPCGFTEKSLEIKNDATATLVPDCDDPDKPGWEDRAVKVTSASVSGQGVLAKASYPTWRTWALAGGSKKVRVEFAGLAGYYEGKAVLTSVKHDGSHGEKIKLSIQLENDGEWTWVAVP